jgi:predicted nucleic acid-binding protein
VLLVDTGPLVAAADSSDRHYADCRLLLESDKGPLVTTPLVIAEAAYLIDRQLGPAAEAALLRSIVGGELVVEHLEHADWVRMADLVDTYSGLALGSTDASLVALGERLAAARLAPILATVGSPHPP